MTRDILFTTAVVILLMVRIHAYSIKKEKAPLVEEIPESELDVLIEAQENGIRGPPDQINNGYGGKKREKELWEIDEEAHTDEIARERGEVAQGEDMFLTPDQVAIETINDRTLKDDDRKRAAVQRVSLLWPKGSNGRVRIPYIIRLSSKRSKTLAHLRTSMKLLSQKTCVDWVPKTGEDATFVDINEDKGGCWSHVGVIPKDKQPQKVNLDSEDCVTQMVSDHELMHTLGFFHEHSRPDRDQYLKIHLNNIFPGKEKQFDKHAWTNTYDLPFDFKSVMLYPPDLASIRRHRVVLVKNPDRHWYNGLWKDEFIKKYIYYQASTMTRIKGGPPEYPPAEKYSQQDYESINIVYKC